MCQGIRTTETADVNENQNPHQLGGSKISYETAMKNRKLDKCSVLSFVSVFNLMSIWHVQANVPTLSRKDKFI